MRKTLNIPFSYTNQSLKMPLMLSFSKKKNNKYLMIYNGYDELNKNKVKTSTHIDEHYVNGTCLKHTFDCD